MSEARITRTCDKCGVEDSEAHHVQYVAFNHPVTGGGVDISVTKHVACCAEDGCPVCSIDVANAPDTSHEGLTAFVQARPAEVLQRLFEEVDMESPDFETAATEESE
jgi:hypothetical protein